MNGFKEGYEYYRKSAGSHAASIFGDEYVHAINDAIDRLDDDLNSFTGYGTDASKLQGDIAEFWHADTFNINAAVKGSHSRAFVDRSHDFASADISTNFGDKYGLKYYKSGAESAKAQAKSVFERFKEYQAQGGKDSLTKFLEERGYTDIDSVLNDPIYTGQIRLIPSDQMEEAVQWLKRKILEEEALRPEQVKRYKETLALLETCIRDHKGTKSIPLSRENAQKLAELAKQGKFDPRELGLSTEELVTYEYILQQSFKAGVSSATISIVLKLAPEVMKAVQYLIAHGELDPQAFKRIGFAAISGASEGFVKGFVSAGLTTACKAGLLGAAAKSVNPNAIGMAVVLALDTMKNAYKVATGAMSRREMTDEMIKETFIASVSFVSGAVMQTILYEVPVLGFMLGSFLGSVVGGIMYTTGYRFMISFCIDTGFTMFGLVKQDYKLPDDVLREIGVDLFVPDRYEPSLFTPTAFEPTRFEPSRFEPTTFRPFFVRRGVIGIREIGYVLQ